MESNVVDEQESEIQQFYAKRSVLITGVTGFLGKILMEKLLRCCPDLKTVYLLIRHKKEKSPEERLDILLEKECFQPLKEKFPTLRDKIAIVVGDVKEPLCGISENDLKSLQRDVSIVFHFAARIRFLDPLRTVVEENTIGARHILELCRELPLLEALIHLSTAFSRRNPDYTVPEEVDTCKAAPNDILSMLKILDDESIKKITPSIIKGNWTTYQFSKALAEIVLEEEKGDLPVSIVRPCIVGPSWKEPLPGWCDTLQGATGLFLAGAKGFLRTLYAPLGFKMLGIPADIVINCSIATAWHVATTRPKGTFVLNCTMKYEDFPIGEEFLGAVLNLREVCPSVNVYRYPTLTLHRSKWLYYMHATVDQYIPAIIIDALLFIFKRRTLMMRLYRRIDVVVGIFTEQGTTPWYFCCDNFNKVKNAMSPKDTEIFFLDTSTANWITYVYDCARAGRQYVLKEDPSTIPYAIKKTRLRWLVTTVLKWCLILLFVYYMIPQSLIDSATMRFQSYMHTSNPVFTQSSDEIHLSDMLDTHIRI